MIAQLKKTESNTYHIFVPDFDNHILYIIFDEIFSPVKSNFIKS